jgi:hypothetical protein
MDGLMKKKVVKGFKLFGVFLGMLFANTAVHAHGGVSIDMDTCVLKIGSYRMHLTGYQPETAMGEEFCEDIPKTGNAIIVLDYVENQLRDMMAGVRIIEKDSWTAAQSPSGDDQAKTILDMPPKLYKTGSVKIERRFDKPGYFVGFLTVEKEGQEKLVSRFPFSVGYGKGGLSMAGGGSRMYAIYGIIALVLVVGGAFYLKQRQKGNQVAV